ncbi:MAG: hypothetical protein GYA33_02225 [Thermogutta sp.]|nr:hypothetical protein [Thermogutta sp.]
MTLPISGTGGCGGGISGRRAWLVGAARWTAAALAVGGGALLSLGRRGEATACPRPACARCGARASCRLPAAQTYRNRTRRSAGQDVIEASGSGSKAT